MMLDVTTAWAVAEVLSYHDLMAAVEATYNKYYNVNILQLSNSLLSFTLIFNEYL